MEELKNSAQEATNNTKQFSKEYGKQLTCVSSIPFHGFIEGPILLTAMKQRCIQHFQGYIYILGLFCYRNSIKEISVKGYLIKSLCEYDFFP